VFGLLVRVRDSGEVLDLAREGLLVQALDVALRQHVDRALRVHLDEVADHLARLVADLAVRRDRGGDHGHAVAAQQVRHERDPANVGVAVLLAEAQALAQVRPDDIAVQHLHVMPALSQRRLQPLRDRRFAGPRKAREPHSEAAFHASPPSNDLVLRVVTG
jgi:hypothetical protein